MTARAPGELRDRRMQAAAGAISKPEPMSPAQRDALLGAEHIERILAEVGATGWKRMLHDWRYFARPTQLEPAGRWLIWLILSGRGWGKSRTGIEWIREGVDDGTANPFGLIGPTRKDVLDRLVYGDAAAPGLVRLYEHFPDGMRPIVNKNEGTIKFPHNGVEGYFYTAEKPEVRGPNMRRWLCDEFAQWPYLRECWDNIEMTTRALGVVPPRICITTTPRPLDVIKELLDDPKVRVTFGSTFANAANLAPTWIARMAKKYTGSRLGQQELYGLLLGDNPDALFFMTPIEAARVTVAPRLKRIALGVDPAISTRKDNDFTGIVAVGLGEDGELYLLLDLTGVELDKKAKGFGYLRPEEPRRHSPEEWGELVVRAARHLGKAYDCPVIVVGERNRGGDLVRSNVLQMDKLTGGAGALPYLEVHATRNKAARAEEVSTLYGQGRVHHVGQHPLLETEITDWNPKLTPTSPNRLDGLVWAAFALMPELGSDDETEEQLVAAARGQVDGLAARNAALAGAPSEVGAARWPGLSREDPRSADRSYPGAGGSSMGRRTVF